MCLLTQRELEFLASLRKSWRRLYWREFARVVREDAVEYPAHPDADPSADLRGWLAPSPRPH